jgi:hypothetical protein
LLNFYEIDIIKLVFGIYNVPEKTICADTKKRNENLTKRNTVLICIKRWLSTDLTLKWFNTELLGRIFLFNNKKNTVKVNNKTDVNKVHFLNFGK